MPVKSALLVLIMGTGLQAKAYWKTDIGPLVVKVYSCFKKGSEACSEGSGLLIHYNGTYGVITSEHVVLPSNEAPVYHKVVDSEGHEAEAKFVKSSWERGLALLQLQNVDGPLSDWINHWGENTPDWDEFGQFGQRVATNSERLYRNWTMGFPAGSKIARTLNDAKFENIENPGSILRRVQVYRFSGIPAEYGMSGGPMFDEYSLTGILTHVRFGKELKTYVIPAQEIYNFMDGREADFITRDFKDFQRQFFSKNKTEIVHHESSQLRIERREDKCIVSAENDVGRIDGLEGSFPGLLSISRKMGYDSIRVAQVNSIGGVACDAQTTLAQFVGLLARSSSVDIIDLESEKEKGDGVSETPHFQADRTQSVTYNLNFRASNGTQKASGWMVASWWNLDVFEVEERTRWSDQLNERQQILPVREAATTDSYRELIRNCKGKGGVIEIITVPIGRFKSCKIKSASQTDWYGPVPIYGLLKSESSDGTTSMVIESVSSQSGFFR